MPELVDSTGYGTTDQNLDNASRLDLLLVISALIANLLLVMVVGSRFEQRTGDSPYYIALGRSIATSGNYSILEGSNPEPDIIRMPGYPLQIALIGSVFGFEDVNFIAANALMYLLSVLLMWRVTFRIFGKGPSRVFLLLTIIYPGIIPSSTNIMSETPALFFVSLLLYLLLEPTDLRLFLGGLAACCATYMRPYCIVFVPLVALVFVVNDRRVSKKVVLFLLASLVPLLPWSYRNHVVTGSYSPSPRYSGLQLYFAVLENATSVDDLIEFVTHGRMPEAFVRKGFASEIAEMNRRIGVPEDSQIQYFYIATGPYQGIDKKLKANELLTAAASKHIKADPLKFLETRILWFMPFLWIPQIIPGKLPAIIEYPMYAMLVIIAVLGLSGLISSLFRGGLTRSPASAVAHGIMPLVSVPLCLLCVQFRFTIPFRLILLAFASHSIFSVYAWARSRRISDPSGASRA